MFIVWFGTVLEFRLSGILLRILGKVGEGRRWKFIFGKYKGVF